MLHQAQQCGPRRHQRPARLLLVQPVQAAIESGAVLIEEGLELGTSWQIEDILSERRWEGGHKRSISAALPTSKLPLIGHGLPPVTWLAGSSEVRRIQALANARRSRWGLGAKVRAAKLVHELVPQCGATLFEQLGANAQRAARGPVAKSPAAELREHGYELDRGFGQAIARTLAGSRVLTGEQSQPDESLESVGENI